MQQLVLLRASEQLLMVAGNTSNVLAEQCVARASFDDDGATAAHGSWIAQERPHVRWSFPRFV